MTAATAGAIFAVLLIIQFLKNSEYLAKEDGDRLTASFDEDTIKAPYERYISSLKASTRLLFKEPSFQDSHDLNEFTNNKVS